MLVKAFKSGLASVIGSDDPDTSPLVATILRKAGTNQLFDPFKSCVRPTWSIGLSTSPALFPILSLWTVDLPRGAQDVQGGWTGWVQRRQIKAMGIGFVDLASFFSAKINSFDRPPDDGICVIQLVVAEIKGITVAMS